MRSREYDIPAPFVFHHANQWGGYECKERASRQSNRNRTRRLGSFLSMICALLAVTSILILFVVIPHYNQSVPSINAASAMMIDATTENVLYHSHETTQRAMASLTKIMTAMIAIESTPDPNRQVIIGDDVARIEDDASKMGCQPGEKYSMKDLLYGLLLPSGDDAAIAIGLSVRS